MSRFDLPSKEKQIEDYDRQMLAEDFWSDQKKAQSVIRKQNSLKDIVTSYNELRADIDSVSEAYDVLKEEMDEDLLEMASEEMEEAAKKMETFQVKVLLRGNTTIPTPFWNSIREPAERKRATGRPCSIACTPATHRIRAGK